MPSKHDLKELQKFNRTADNPEKAKVERAKEKVEDIILEKEIESTKPCVEGKEQEECLDSKLSQGECVNPKLSQGECVNPKLSQGEFVNPKLSQGEFVNPKLSQREFVNPKLSQGECVNPKLSQEECLNSKLSQEIDEHPKEVKQANKGLFDKIKEKLFDSKKPINRAILERKDDDQSFQIKSSEQPIFDPIGEKELIQEKLEEIQADQLKANQLDKKLVSFMQQQHETKKINPKSVEAHQKKAMDKQEREIKNKIKYKANIERKKQAQEKLAERQKKAAEASREQYFFKSPGGTVRQIQDKPEKVFFANLGSFEEIFDLTQEYSQMSMSNKEDFNISNYQDFKKWKNPPSAKTETPITKKEQEPMKTTKSSGKAPAPGVVKQDLSQKERNLLKDAQSVIRVSMPISKDIQQKEQVSQQKHAAAKKTDTVKEPSKSKSSFQESSKSKESMKPKEPHQELKSSKEIPHDIKASKGFMPKETKSKEVPVKHEKDSQIHSKKETKTPDMTKHHEEFTDIKEKELASGSQDQSKSKSFSTITGKLPHEIPNKHYLHTTDLLKNPEEWKISQKPLSGHADSTVQHTHSHHHKK